MFSLVKRNSFLPRNVFDDDWSFKELDRIFGSTTGANANVFRTDEGFTIEIEAPGVKKDDFKLEILNNVLTVSCNIEKKKEEEGNREFYRRCFKRSWTLPKGTDEDAISANYDAGILKLNVPVFNKEQEIKQIEIK